MIVLIKGVQMLSPILSVKSVADSFRFYVDVLGFAEGFQMKDESGIVNFAMVKLGKIEIMLGVMEGFVNSEDRNRVGLGIQLHIALPDDVDIDALYQRALAASANITRQIENREWGERAFNLKDPDGYHFMFTKPI
jgi:uncharacterized glyoxalase superfamily protein PhnB